MYERELMKLYKIFSSVYGTLSVSSLQPLLCLNASTLNLRVYVKQFIFVPSKAENIHSYLHGRMRVIFSEDTFVLSIPDTFSYSFLIECLNDICDHFMKSNFNRTETLRVVINADHVWYIMENNLLAFFVSSRWYESYSSVEVSPVKYTVCYRRTF